MAQFTDQQKSAVRIHLGLPDTAAVPLIVSGERMVADAVFAVDKAMELANQSVVPRVLQYLAECEKIDEEIGEIAGSREFDSVDKLKVNREALNDLEQLKDYWGQRIAIALGVKYYKASFAAAGGGGNRLNGTWMP